MLIRYFSQQVLTKQSTTSKKKHNKAGSQNKASTDLGIETPPGETDLGEANPRQCVIFTLFHFFDLFVLAVIKRFRKEFSRRLDLLDNRVKISYCLDTEEIKWLDHDGEYDGEINGSELPHGLGRCQKSDGVRACACL